MNDLHSSNIRPLTLFIAGSMLTITAILWCSFPVLIFMSLAPIFALLDFEWSSRKVYFIVVASMVGVSSELVLYNFGVNTPVLLSVFLVVGLFSTFISVQKLTQNRFNKFTLVIVFMAIEYLMVKLIVQTKPVFLADILRCKPEWTRWNISTGYLGASLWIMTTNLLFYQAIFKSKQVNVFLIVLGLFCILLPILYSLSLENSTVTKPEMLELYSGSTVRKGNAYDVQGELISRTGAWVSLLIIIFTLVRIKTKKVAR